MNPLFRILPTVALAAGLAVLASTTLPTAHAAELNVQVRVDEKDAAVVKEAAEAVKEATKEVASEARSAAREARRAARQAAREAAAAENRAEAELDDADWEKFDAGEPTNNLNPEHRMQEVVQFGKRVHIGTNEYAPTVVVFFENAVIDGRAGEVVVIGGTAQINGRVREQVVSVFGRAKIGPNARVGHQVVAVGGGVDRAEGSHIGDQVVSIPLPGFDDLNFELPAALKNSFRELVVKARLLSFNVKWVWPVYGAVLIVNLLVASIFPGASRRTADTLSKRPVGSILMGLAALPLGFLVAILFAATGIGVLIWPFLFAAFVIAAIFGKAALAQHLGHSIARQFGGDGLLAPLVAFLVGSLLLTVLYLVPFLGLITWKVATMWGLGAALLALFSSFRDEMPPAPIGASASASTGAGSIPVYAPVSSDPSTAAASSGPSMSANAVPGADPTAPPSGSGPVPPVAPALIPAPSAPEALTEVRSGFWRKAGAMFIDVAVLGLATGWLLPAGFILWLAYFAGMWTWKGTTIGGLVLGLRVVRLDGRPMDLPTAVVRALGGALGYMICFLGVLWPLWDRDKQGWHDKMAGTVVIRTNVAQTLV